MDEIIDVMLMLVANVIANKPIDIDKIEALSEDEYKELILMSSAHDITPILSYAFAKNGLFKENPFEHEFKNQLSLAVYRYEKSKYELNELKRVFNEAKISFIPLKGAVIRDFYPDPALRTSCDIDILVKEEELKKAVNTVEDKLNYKMSGRTAHDISFLSPSNQHLELHYKLIEEEKLSDKGEILKAVWENASPINSGDYCYKMTDEYFYFYHIAHMAKHVKGGGCGVRPFIDLCILDNMRDIDKTRRDALLERGGLLKFANAVRKLSETWFEKTAMNDLSLKLHHFILSGGIYGSSANKVAIDKFNKGGKIRYFFTRVFAPYSKLKGYYPILNKYPWLMPLMQIRRWGKLFTPSVRNMARNELRANKLITNENVEEINLFMKKLGLE